MTHLGVLGGDEIVSLFAVQAHNTLAERNLIEVSRENDHFSVILSVPFVFEH